MRWSLARDGRAVAALRRGDQLAYGGLVARAQQGDRVGIAVDDLLEERLAVLVGGQRALGPTAHLVEQHGEAGVLLPPLVGHLALDSPWPGGGGAGRGGRGGPAGRGGRGPG